ncbi:MAG: hypothetical protein ACK5N8_00235 [Alphaproteobacteria bacterium]
MKKLLFLLFSLSVVLVSAQENKSVNLFESAPDCYCFEADTVIIHKQEEIPCKIEVVNIEDISDFFGYLLLENKEKDFFIAWCYDFSDEDYENLKTLAKRKIRLFYGYKNSLIKYEEM